MRELLLLLCQYPFDDKNREPLSKLIDEVRDWSEMVKLINAHGIIALAAYNIREAGLEKKIPGDALAVLDNGYLMNIVRNTWLTECWKEVNNILCNAGIKHILLKGMALEHTIYGSRGLRQMNDNDILIKHEESIKAWNLLLNAGYTFEPLKSPLFRKIRGEINQHLPTLYKNGYAIEIHDRLFNNQITSELGILNLFENANEILVNNIKALILSKEIQLKHLIYHFENHTSAGDCQLRLFTDIILLDKCNELKIEDQFISNPLQGKKTEFRKAAYKFRVKAISPKYRLRFLLGDTFPSIKWMEDRYNCNWVKASLMYPLRIGKLAWLIT